MCLWQSFKKNHFLVDKWIPYQTQNLTRCLWDYFVWHLREACTPSKFYPLCICPKTTHEMNTTCDRIDLIEKGECSCKLHKRGRSCTTGLHERRRCLQTTQEKNTLCDKLHWKRRMLANYTWDDDDLVRRAWLKDDSVCRPYRRGKLCVTSSIEMRGC